MGIPHWLLRIAMLLRTLFASLLGRREDRVPPPPAPSAPYDLGELPAEVTVRWPTPPRIEHEVEIVSSTQIEDRWRGSNTRLRVRVDLDWLVLDADDLEVVVDDGVRIGRVFIARSRKRIRFEGGSYGQIELALPGQYVPAPPEWREEWMVEDVMFRRVHVAPETDSGFLLRGKRIAILHSVVESVLYGIWLGDTDRFQSEDIILAGNRIESDRESTIRFENVLGAILVNNWIQNPSKATVSIHGRSDDVVLARNTLVDGGLSIGILDVDALGDVWVIDNTLHHTTGNLLATIPDRVRRLELTDDE